jgi:hypothetical protein
MERLVEADLEAKARGALPVRATLVQRPDVILLMPKKLQSPPLRDGLQTLSKTCP